MIGGGGGGVKGSNSCEFLCQRRIERKQCPRLAKGGGCMLAHGLQ